MLCASMAIPCGRWNCPGPVPGVPHSRTRLPAAVYSRMRAFRYPSEMKIRPPGANAMSVVPRNRSSRPWALRPHRSSAAPCHVERTCGPSSRPRRPSRYCRPDRRGCCAESCRVLCPTSAESRPAGSRRAPGRHASHAAAGRLRRRDRPPPTTPSRCSSRDRALLSAARSTSAAGAATHASAHGMGGPARRAAGKTGTAANDET